MMRTNIAYYIKEGVKNVFLHGFMSVAAVGVIAACLLITGSFSLVALNIDAAVEDAESRTEISVFVDEEYPESKALMVKENIMQIEHVKTAEFVSKEQALAEFRAELGEEADVLDGLKGDNPLRDGYRIRMDDASFHADIVKALKDVPGIANIESRADISEKLVKIRKLVSAVCLALIALLGGVSIFIIANTVKLTTFARREEIAIMKMVGASNNFVRGPFVVECFVLGEVGALGAYFLLMAFYNYMTGKLLADIDFLNILPFAAVRGELLLMMLGLGALIGIGASFMTIRRFLKV